MLSAAMVASLLHAPPWVEGRRCTRKRVEGPVTGDLYWPKRPRIRCINNCGAIWHVLIARVHAHAHNVLSVHARRGCADAWMREGGRERGTEREGWHPLPLVPLLSLRLNARICTLQVTERAGGGISWRMRVRAKQNFALFEMLAENHALK